jgi:hypothetical protein
MTNQHIQNFKTNHYDLIEIMDDVLEDHFNLKILNDDGIKSESSFSESSE